MAVQDMNPSSSQSAHRLPTISASQALRSLKISGPRAISTSLKRLDALLHPNTPSPAQGGLSRGQVTEIYGPPGSGKTALGLQASKNALQRGGHVVWIDAADSVPKPRLEALLSTSPTPSPEGLSASVDESLSATDMLQRFHHYHVSTLAHLLALCLHSPSAFPPQGTALIIVESVSTLFDSAYPRTRATKDNKNDAANWAAGRRYSVMNSLISALGKIAAIRDVPVVVTNQVATRYREDSALLVPAMAGLEWDNGIAARLVIFRDWPPDPGRLVDLDDEKRKQIRYIGIVKVAGVGVRDADGLGAIVPFTIGPLGLSDVDLKTVEVPLQALTSPVRPSTRTYTEVPDSEDELGSDEMYGWGEDDEIAAEGLLIDEAALANSPSKEKSDQRPQKRRRTEGPERASSAEAE